MAPSCISSSLFFLQNPHQMNTLLYLLYFINYGDIHYDRIMTVQEIKQYIQKEIKPHLSEPNVKRQEYYRHNNSQTRYKRQTPVDCFRKEAILKYHLSGIANWFTSLKLNFTKPF